MYVFPESILSTQVPYVVLQKLESYGKAKYRAERDANSCVCSPGKGCLSTHFIDRQNRHPTLFFSFISLIPVNPVCCRIGPVDVSVELAFHG